MLPIRISWWRGFWRDRRFLVISLTLFFALALDSLSLLRSVSDDGGRTGDLGLNNQRLKKRSVDSSPMNNDPIDEENDDYDETQFRVGRRILYENESYNEIDGKKVKIPLKKLNMNYQEAKQRHWDRKNCVPKPKGAAPAGGNGTAPGGAPAPPADAAAPPPADAAAAPPAAPPARRRRKREDAPPAAGNGTAAAGNGTGNGTAGPRIIYCEDLPPLNGGAGGNGTRGGNGTAPAASPAGAPPADAAAAPPAAPPPA